MERGVYNEMLCIKSKLRKELIVSENIVFIQATNERGNKDINISLEIIRPVTLSPLLIGEGIQRGEV